MDRNKVMGVSRLVALTLLAALIWAIAKYGYVKPEVLAADAPVSEFSAGRAYATLGRLLGPEVPHPVSSDANAAVRARIEAEFARLGVGTSTYTAFACNAWRGFKAIPCATVTDILAEVVPGEGKAIVLLAHYDSVPAGPGASDDQSGVATVLETARALRARGTKGLHPVLAVITDGEEAGLLGAQAFLENAALKARVGAVVNVEARGTRGRSLLFQTSPGDGRLIDLYARAVPFYATSSLFAEIYKLLPNDTDLTLFIKQGFPSFNFAFSENVADYHTPLDRRSNLSPLTLQEQGDNMLGVALQLEETPFADLKGSNAVYLDLFGAVLPRMPAAWALPLSLLSFLLLLGAAYRARNIAPAGEWVRALAVPPLVLIASAGAGFVLYTIARLVSGQPDPTYAHPLAMRVALALGVVFAAVLAGRMSGPRATAFGVWLWFGVFSIAASALVPGLSPYFLFPLLAAAIMGLAGVAAPGLARGWIAEAALAVAVLSALSIWLSLTAAGETLMGLRLHPLFTVPAAFAAVTLVPLVDARAMTRTAWTGSLIVSLVAAACAAAAAGLQPAYSPVQALRLSIRYVEQASTGKAQWALDANAPLPVPLRGAADFSSMPSSIFAGLLPPTYNAPAGAARLPSPRATVAADTSMPGRYTVRLQGSPQTGAMFLYIPQAAKLRRIDLRGQHVVIPNTHDGDTLLACLSRDCANEDVGLVLGAPAEVTFAEERYGLPTFASKLVAARPPTAIPSQNGDATILVGSVKLAGK